MELIKRILAYFFTTLSDLKAAQLPIKTGKSDKDMIKVILSKFVKPQHIRKKKHEAKIRIPPSAGLNFSDSLQSGRIFL